MKPSEILRAGLEKLGPAGEHWIKGSYAKDADGNSCDYNVATCFCGIGAIRSAVMAPGVRIFTAHDSTEDSYASARNLLHRITPNGFWPVWQDKSGRTFPEVKAKFLEAIAAAELDEQVAA